MKKTLLLVLLAFCSLSLALAQTKLTWYGHSAFKIVTPAGKVVLIDPWIQNPLNKNAQADLAALGQVDLILVSHGHFDHVGDAVAIAKQTKAKLVTPFDLGQSLVKYAGYPADQAGFDTQGNIGGTLVLLDGELSVQFTPANHGSNVADEKGDFHPGGNPCGFLIKVNKGPTFYHTGDTGLVSEMSFLGKQKVDVMLCCIGDHFVMGPAQAAEAVRMVAPQTVVPMHYQTFPILRGTPEAFGAELSKAGSKAKLQVMKVGETLSL